MLKDYSTYQATDFLVDDYFVDSMLDPTSESEAFWKVCIDENRINTDEFISAYMTLKSLHENKPTVPVERIDLLWRRIVETNKSRQFKIKRYNYFRYVAVACCIAGVVGFSILTLSRTCNTNSIQSIADFAHENIIHVRQPNTQIQLISCKKTLSFNGTQAEVEYDTDGNVKVNNKSVSTSKTSATAEIKPTYNQLRVPYGKRAFLKLSDGTSLWVNTGTTVIYPTTFAKDKREIFVEGEVFAEVFHDSKHPFIIKTEKLDIQVLGTVFNVSAYKEDKQTNVVLVSGSVNVKPKDGRATIVKPNQLFAYTEQASTLRNVDVESYTSWHDGNYIFRNEPIENILLRLSRYYNVTMKLPSTASGITCSGRLELKDDLVRLLNGLTEITSMSFAVKDNEYRIRFE